MDTEELTNKVNRREQFYYDQILDAIPVGIWLMNDKAKTTFVNKRMMDWLEGTSNQLHQKSLDEFLKDFNTSGLLMTKAPHLTSGFEEVTYKTVTGNERILNRSVVSLKNSDNGVPSILAIHTEPQRTAESKEDVSTLNEQRIIDSLKDYAVMTVDINRTILSWNTGATSIFGYDENEIVGKSADVLFTDDDKNNGVANMEVMAAFKIGYSYDDRWHLRKDGSTFFASGVMTRLSQGDEVPRFIKIARDWTERKKLEEMLKNADRYKNEFLATLAHELRNPLASILSGMEVLKQNKDKSIDFKTREIIERQVQQMIHLVNDLLDISRISLGKIKLVKQDINLIDAIHLALETSRPIIEGYKHALTVSLPSGPIIVNGDMTRLSQVFLNVLINSAKYTPQKGKITLTVNPDLDKSQVTVIVNDNGMGIPKTMLASIFEMFEQVQDRSELPQAGLGIGLSVVKQLVEMHDGHVEAYSAGTNLGSEFTITLPIVNNSELVYPQSTRLNDVPVKKTFVSKAKKILLVDDNMDAADMMDLLLTRRGYSIRKANDGETAIKLASEFNPDIVILDLGLPDISGYEVLKVLKKTLGERFYLALSGWGQEDDIRKSNEAGFNHHLVKPVDISTLIDLLQSV